ncbi:hypothetical protein GOV14_02550 [Candidatus Pacearchaeota archaeon]|nr:hypothetical protein [Candidatus Pacearchaeota archaeon]
MNLKTKIKRKLVKMFTHKHYIKIMYVTLLVTSLLILFSFVSIFNEIKQTNAKTISGHAVEEINNTNMANQEMTGQLYTRQSYFIYYLALILIGCGVIIASVRLKATIWENIKKEEESIWKNE